MPTIQASGVHTLLLGNLMSVTATPLAPWLTPEGFRAPSVTAVLREASAITEAGRFALGALERRRLRYRSPYAGLGAVRHATPVILVPGFLAGDSTLGPMSRVLREQGYRTYRSSIHLNAGCTLNAAAQLESRLESIALRRGSRCRSSGTASAECSRAGSPYAGPTWLPESSRWAARCWHREPTTRP